MYCAHSAATYGVWLWTWLGLYIATYPEALVASLTKTLGISWHSQGITFYIAYKPHSGTSSRRRRTRSGWRKSHQPQKCRERCTTFSSLLLVRGQNVQMEYLPSLPLLGGILSSSVLTFPCPLTESPDLDCKFDREQTSHDPFQYWHLYGSRGRGEKHPATSLQWGEEHSSEQCHLLIKGCSRFFLRARGGLEHCPISA